MNVGIDASRAAMSQPTGTEHYSWRLINALLRLPHKNRYRLYLRERPPDGHFFDAPHAEQVVMPFPRLWTHVRLSAEVLFRPPDVLFVPAHVLPLVHPRNSVVTVMDLGHRHYPEAHPWRDRLYLEWSTRRNAHRASRIIAISGATRDDLIRSYGTDPAKITVIYPGIDEEIAREEDPGRLSEVRTCYGLPDSYLLYIGTLHPRKNLVRVIHAFGRMLSEWPPESGLPPALVLAGKKGWHYDRIFAEARDLGLENHVIFLGYVPQDFLLPLLSGARAFVFPSLFEGFGFPVLEAMACQVPVVTSRASCLPEVAGDAALLVDPHDEAALARAMTRVSVDSDLRSVLIERGIRRVREFTWERCAGETMAVLEKPNAR
jgi:glycosyltransferase involved in cell wall biosynthesis